MTMCPCMFRHMVRLLGTGALLLGVHGSAAAQLSGTAWPMFQHDVRHTLRDRTSQPASVRS